jgi:hypothetical protein
VFFFFFFFFFFFGYFELSIYAEEREKKKNVGRSSAQSSVAKGYHQTIVDDLCAFDTFARVASGFGGNKWSRRRGRRSNAARGGRYKKVVSRRRRSELLRRAVRGRERERCAEQQQQQQQQQRGRERCGVCAEEGVAGKRESVSFFFVNKSFLLEFPNRLFARFGSSSRSRLKQTITLLEYASQRSADDDRNTNE